MGKRYEKSKKDVGENKQTIEGLKSDNETLQKEYAPLMEIVGLQGLLDDEVADSIHNVSAVEVVESKRISSETDAAEKEKEQITENINSEIGKLTAGLDKLRRASNLEFGKQAVEQSGREYKKQIDKFKELLGDLGSSMDTSSSSGSGVDGITASVENSLKNAEDSPTPLLENEVVFVPYLEPNRQTPRDLPTTQYGFTTDASGIQTYDSPNEMDQYLYKTQGSAYVNFKGTCGLCSCANILRLAGVNCSEKDMIDYASSTENPNSFFGKLCTVNPFNASASGGTGPRERQAILEHFGVSSGGFPVKMAGSTASDETLEEIANYVADGKGVILSIHASVLEPIVYRTSLRADFHAVTVTSVTRNKHGDVSGFYICDSNLGTRHYSANTLREALTGNDMNVTHSHIR